jgi:hypothetical protein
VARGFIPAGVRSSPKTIQRGDSVRSGKPDLRLLRSRTGINPLTTGVHSRLFMAGPYCGEGIYPRWVAKQPQTIQRGDSVRSGKPDLRLLRSRTGINPLTTEVHSDCLWPGHTVARGFIPAGLRSSPKTIQRGDSVRSDKQDLRLLRSRTGINPLTTGIHPRWVAKRPRNHSAR